MAEFLRADIHEKILAIRILTIQALNGVLHCGSQLAVGAAELLQQHVAEPDIGLVYAYRKHQLLDMVIHRPTFRGQGGTSTQPRRMLLVPGSTTAMSDAAKASLGKSVLVPKAEATDDGTRR